MIFVLLMGNGNALQVLPSQPFIPNKGIANERIKFLKSSPIGNIKILDNGTILYEVFHYSEGGPRKLTFKEVFPKTKVKGGKVARTKVNIFTKDNPLTGIQTFKTVSMGTPWKGIGVQLQSVRNNIEKVFIVFPYSEPAQIRVKIEGIDNLRVNARGELELQIKGETLTFSKPIAYQLSGQNKKIPVEVSYRTEGNSYGFRVGEYDKSKVLYIDPLIASTYFGGSDAQTINDVKVGPDGKIYVLGVTDNSLFYTDTTTPPAGAVNYLPPTATTANNREIFIARLSPDLSTLEIITYLISYGIDSAGQMVVVDKDPATPNTFGVYFVGQGAFGGTQNPQLPCTNQYVRSGQSLGDADAFIAALDQDLQNPLITCLGSNRNEGFSTIDVYRDSSGQLYFFAAGYSGGNPPTDFDGAGGLTPYQPDNTNTSYTDWYVVRFDANLIPQIGTMLGGSSDEGASDIEVDSDGNVWVAGFVQHGIPAFSVFFPTTTGAFSTYDDWDTGAVVKLSFNLDQLLISTLIDSAWDGTSYPKIVLYPSKNTSTLQRIFAVAPSGMSSGSRMIFAFTTDLANRVTFDAGVLVSDPSKSVAYSSLEIGPNGRLWIGGSSNDSLNLSFSPHSFRPRQSESYFIARLSYNPHPTDITQDNLTLEKMTLIGGTNAIFGCGPGGVYAINFDSSNNVIIAGMTHFDDFPTTSGVLDTTFGGCDTVTPYTSVQWGDGFITILDYDLFDPNTAPVITAFNPDQPSYNQGDTATFSWTIDHTESDTITCDLDIDSDGTPEYTGIDCMNTTSQTHTFTQSGTFNVKLLINDQYFTGANQVTQTITVVVNSLPVINSFSANPSPIDVSQSTTFSWNISDPDGDPLTCAIDVNNDGTAEQTITNCTNSSTYTHTFNQAGTYTVKLTVTDSNGGSTQRTLTLIVNTPPVINSFTANPNSGNAPLDVTFSWDISDADGDTLICRIDVDNDGTWDYEITACPEKGNQKHTFNQDKTFTVKFSIVDENGTTANKTITVKVTKLTSPEDKGDQQNKQTSKTSGSCNTTGNLFLIVLTLFISFMIRKKKKV